MSRATGLMAEWALAAGCSDIALIYSYESLAWGAEPHRIRSYLAYANASQAKREFCPREEIDLLLSTEATRLQADLSNREIYGTLHQLRLNALQLMSKFSARHEMLKAQTIESLASLCPNQNSNQTPAMLAICTSGALAEQLGLDSYADQLEEARDFLIKLGRWRDCQLLFEADPSRFPELNEMQQEFLSCINAITEKIDLPGAGPVDLNHLESLTTSVPAGDPASALRRFLCCI